MSLIKYVILICPQELSGFVDSGALHKFILEALNIFFIRSESIEEILKFHLVHMCLENDTPSFSCISI